MSRKKKAGGLPFAWYACEECGYETIFPNNERCLRCGHHVEHKLLTTAELRERALSNYVPKHERGKKK